MKPWRSNLWLGAAVIGVLSAQPAWAQEESPGELKKEIEAVKESLKSIQKDIQEIKTLLQTRPPGAAPPQNVVVDLGNNAFKGERTAKLTLVEFSDYQ